MEPISFDIQTLQTLLFIVRLESTVYMMIFPHQFYSPNIFFYNIDSIRYYSIHDNKYIRFFEGHDKKYEH